MHIKCSCRSVRCKGCENMCGTVLKAQANMGEANQTCLEACLWRINLCLDAQKFSKDVTVPRETAGTMCAGWSVLWQKTQYALWGMKTSFCIILFFWLKLTIFFYFWPKITNFGHKFTIFGKKKSAKHTKSVNHAKSSNRA